MWDESNEDELRELYACGVLTLGDFEARIEVLLREEAREDYYRRNYRRILADYYRESRWGVAMHNVGTSGWKEAALTKAANYATATNRDDREASLCP